VSDGSASPAPSTAPRPDVRYSLAAVLEQHEKTFSEYLLDLLKERDGKDSEVYKRAEVSKQLFSKILNNPDYQPTKSTVIQLALGLELDLAQTQKFLGKAGYALTRSSKADLVIQYYIERKIYNVAFINEALDDCGLPLLKTGLKV
jgi:DNA-binding phage protein